jgi:pimeloyl-ACP methyl ester carboxylesterase
MSSTWVTSICLCAAFAIATHLLGSGRGPRGDLFWDDFSRPSEQWQDMRVWGFGVWQVKEGTFVSREEAAPEQTIYAAAPRFAHALLNRDYSVVFRYRPVAGTYYLFSVNTRQHGWDCYKFEVDGNGVVRIVKARIGQAAEVLASSSPATVKFGRWQWVRLDVRGESPLLLRAKVWQGGYKDEPPLYDAVAKDTAPLPPSQLSMSLNMVQQGGAHTAIDDFSVHSRVRPSPLWQWAKVKSMGNARPLFAQGRLWAVQQVLQAAVAQGKATWATYNNLALVAAEKGDVLGALQLLDKALEMAPGERMVRTNLALLWRGLAQDGPLNGSAQTKQLGLIVKPDRQVYYGREPGRLSIWVLHPAYGGPAVESLRASIQDSSGRVIWEVADCQVPDSSTYAAIPLEFDPSAFADGLYTVVASAGEVKAMATFEVVGSTYRRLTENLAAIRGQVAEGRRQPRAEVHANDWANLEVLLLPVERALAQAGVPGLLRSQQNEATAALAQASAAVAALQAGQNPWAHLTGTFLRGYYSQVDGSVQGYAVHVPAAYDGHKPYPLVVNLHGYDPSFSDWRDNPFLLGFIPEATEGGRYILVNPFGRGNTMYQGIGEHDVLSVLADVQRLYRIDPDRIYLTGGSMGGGGTWYVGLRHPDLFAALAPVMGPTDYGFWLGVDSTSTTPLGRFLLAKKSPLSYAQNARNLALRCVHGAKDDIVPVAQSRAMVARLRQLGYPITYDEYAEAAHGGFPPEMERGKYEWFAQHVRTRWPRHVSYTTADLDHAGAYWAHIQRFEDLLDFASIDAQVESQQRIVVRTHNVSRFSLEVPHIYCPPGSPLEVVIDGRVCYRGEVPAAACLCFASADGGWASCPPDEPTLLRKRPGLAGPISSAFEGPFLLVYGTVGRQQENAVAKAEADT